jgi:riboflavin biosynthesis pyrimidine reductase
MEAGGNPDETARFSLLADDTPVGDDVLDRLYGYPAAPERCVVRGNMIASLDGAATTDGTSGGLGGAGDRRLFALQREMADVIVVGAGTARAENYGGARMTAAQRQRRGLRGQSEVPPIALVTRSGVVEPSLRVLTDSEVRPLILTCTAAAAAARARVGSAAEVVDCSRADPGQVDLGAALHLLAGRGLLRVLTEGGPSLLGAFIAAQLLDELCLTSAPLLVGGSAVRIAVGLDAAGTPMHRAHVLTDADGYLYTRHVRAG